MGFVAGMAVDSAGTLSTSYLGTSDVPAGATYINGFAFSADGALYICDWDDAPFYERGVARRADGAVYAVEAEPDVIYMGWGLSSRGELCVDASGTPSYYDEGIAVTDSGKIVVSEGVGGGAWTPASLFASGEVGAWYDPSDLDTMFQAVIGVDAQIPSTLETTVGLILDKSKGLALSDELMGDYTTAFTNVTAGVATITANQIDINNTTGAIAVCYTDTSYLNAYDECAFRVSFTISNFSGPTTASTFRFGATNASDISIGGNGTYSQVLTNYGQPNGLGFAIGNGNSFTITNISIKKIAGNHAYQATAASRPILRARYNLLTYSEQFDNAAWTKTTSTITPDQTTAPDGTTTADLWAGNAAATLIRINHIPTISLATEYVISYHVKTVDAPYFSVFISNGGISGQVETFDLSDGSSVISYTISTGGGIVITSRTATSLGDGWYRFAIGFTSSTDTTPAIYLYLTDRSGNTATAAPTAGPYSAYIWGAQLDYGSTALPYQRIAAATDYVTSSTMETYDFPYYLDFDGVDDNLITAAIDLSASDALTAAYGLDLEGASGPEIIGELGQSNSAGEFGLSLNASRYFSSNVRGSSFTTATGTDAASGSYVVTQLGDISDDVNQIRLNGSLYVENTGDLGTGNLASASTFQIGARAATYYTNGKLFSLVVRNALTSGDDLTSLESYIAGKSGVTLA